jgi:hypothetical protein
MVRFDQKIMINFTYFCLPKLSEMTSFKLMFLLFAVAVSAQTSTKNFGAFATAVFLNVNGNKEYYACSGSGVDRISNLDFYTHLGVFKRHSQDLRIAGGEIKSYAKTNANVCLGKLHYRLYKQNNPPKNKIYKTFDLPWESDCNWGFFENSPGPCNEGDQKWQSENKNLDLTSLCAGDYTLEVFFKLIGSHKNTTKCDEQIQIYKDENKTAFKMNFTIHEDFYLKAFTPKNTVNEGEDISLLCESKNQGDIVKYVWKHPKFTSIEQNPIVKNIKYKQSGIYTLWVNTNCGKWFKKEVEINVVPKPKIISKKTQKIPVKTSIPIPPSIPTKEEITRAVTTNITEIKPSENIILEKPVIIQTNEIVKSEIEIKRDSRYSKKIKDITYKNPNIKILIRDYDIEDGDVLSVFYNYNLIGEKIEVKKIGQSIELNLNENTSTHELIFVAESFGKISPNTSEIEMIVDDKLIKYRITTSKTVNAKFEFKSFYEK